MATLLAVPFGRAYTENHTLDRADDTLGGDEDWFRIDIDTEEFGIGFSLLIEAVSKDASVYPVIEVFKGMPATVPIATLPQIEGTNPPVTGPDPSNVNWSMWDSWFAGNGASVGMMFAPTDNGTYYVRVRPYYQGDYGQGGAVGYAEGGAGSYQLRLKVGTAQRLSGSDRYRTSVAVSKEMFANGVLAGGACVVANGLGFADALAGSTLAGAVGGPLLLTGPKGLDPGVRSEISRLGVSTVYVLGGTAALPSAVYKQIDAIAGVTAVRIAGADRYATARAISKKAYQLNGGGPAMAIVASGANFPDALSASPLAAHNVAPILLTRPDKLSTQVETTIADLGITDVVIVGGDAAVSKAVKSRLEKVLGGAGHVRRVAGANRYLTSDAFATWATDAKAATWDGTIGTSSNPAALNALWPLQSGVASGLKFPDALSGGTMSGLAGCPLLLIDESDAARQAYVSYLNSVGAPQTKVYAFGGASAVSEGLLGLVEVLTLPGFWE